MFLFAQNTVLNLLMMLTLNIAGLQPVFQGESVEVVQKRYEDGVAERNAIVDEMRGLETRHKRLVGQIINLKKQNNSGLTVRLALENQLREAQQISENLAQLQERIRVMDNRLGANRTQLINTIEGHIQGVESKLRSAPASERRALVLQLNGLKAERARFAEPLPAAPSVEELDATLTLAARADSPEDLIAAADELQDTEDKLRRRLLAVETRLDELKASKRLVRRAQGFSREERFFEETDRDRVIARYERTTTVNTSANQATSNTQTPTPPANQNDNAQNNAAPQAGFDFEAVAEADPVRNSPDLTVSDGYPKTPTGGDDSVFDTTTRESIIIHSAIDPSRTLGLDGTSALPVDRQIDALETEKARLKKQADLLNTRANQLRSRAKSR